MARTRILLAVVVFGCAALTFWKWRGDRDAALAMVRDINAVSRVHPRPTHRPPEGTDTFEACAARQVAAMPDAGDYRRYATPPDGGVRAKVLPADALADVDLRLRPWAEGMLSCTLRPTVGDVTSMTPFQAIKAPAWPAPLHSPEFLMMYLPQRAIDLDLEAGQHARALSRCIDLLAFLRDWAPLRGLAVDLFAANVKELMLTPCATALGRADAPARRDFTRELRAVREATLPWNEILRRELLVWELRYFGWQLSDGAAAELPPLVNLQRPAFDGSQVFSLFSHREFRARMAERVRIAGLPPEERRAWRAKLGSDLAIEQVISDARYLDSEARHESAERALDLLESAGRVLLGDPPLPGVTAEPIDGGTRLQVAVVNAVDGGVTPRTVSIFPQ